MIKCENCEITIKLKKDKMVASVRWIHPRQGGTESCFSNSEVHGVKQTYTNECKFSEDKLFIIPHPDKGFYYLNGNKITYVISDVKSQIILYDKTINYNWFGSFNTDEIVYFPKYNTIMFTFFGGDHDYIWWWKLNKKNQDANIKKPVYYNGCFNASLSLYKANDRYAVGTYSNYNDTGYDSSGSAESDDENIPVLTIIFDTKKMMSYEYEIKDLKEKLGIKKNISYRKLQQNFIDKIYVD